MKFGDHLNESAVPEWRDKYIDYKGGKKRLKECRKLLSLEIEQLASGGSSSNISHYSQSHPSVRSRSSQTVKNYTFLQRQCGKDFLENWLIGEELNKCNEFYLWLLEQSKKTFVVLQYQISFYQKQRDTELELKSLTQLHGVSKRYGSIGGSEGNAKRICHDYMGRFKDFLVKNDLWPSWPKGLTGVWGEKSSHRGRETFNRASLPVTADQAKKLLSDALIDFYNYLQLVKTFRDLNVTGFRKMVKKFDKTCKTGEMVNMMDYAKNNYLLFQHVHASVTLMTQRMQQTTSAQATGKVKVSDETEDPLIFWENKMTEWYTKDLASSDSAQKRHNKRLKKLSVQYTLNEQMIHRNNRAIVQMFFSGIGLGISTALITYTLYLSFFYKQHNFMIHKILFPLWGGWYMVLFLATLFQLDCFIWHRIGINYRFIMLGEFHSKNGTQLFNNDFATSAISLQLYFLTFLVVPCAICAIISFHWRHVTPCGFIYIGVIVFLFICPNGVIPYWDKVVSMRKWIFVAIFRLVFSGLYPVEFGDFFIGDIVCSLTYSMSDIAMFFCVYSSTPNNQCGSSHSKAVNVMACIPNYWRFMQCLRRFGDSGDWFPHLLNAIKYALGIAYYGFLSAYRLSGHSKDIRPPFILFAALYAIVAAGWDLIMDWSLFQTAHQNWLLRNDLYLAGKKNWKTGKYSLKGKLIYYVAMVLDVLIRFQWIVYAVAPKTIQQSAKTSFILALTEAFRRFIWIIFRVENEHVANVHLFKVNGESPLPYPVYNSSEDSELLTRDSTTVDSISLSNLASTLEEPIAAYHSMLRRKTGILDSLSRSIPWAHAGDFQRPPTYNYDNNQRGQDSDSESETESFT